jgi:predicted permease
MLETLGQDIRYGVRMLARSPGFTATAVLTLAIGIGATTTIFSQVNAIFWRKLPVSRPEQLRTMVWTSPKRGFVAGVQVNRGPRLPNGGETFSSYSYPIYKAMRDATTGSFSDLAMWTDVSDIRPVVMGELGFGSVHFVSGNYFRALGVNTILGRPIQPEDDREGSVSAVAVISYRFWQRAFGGDAEVLKKPLSLNGAAFSIIGVLPQGFFGMDPSVSPDVMIPISMVQVAAAGGAGVLNSVGNYLVCGGVVGRLRPGISDDQARRESEAAMQDLITRNPPPPRFAYELPKVWTIPIDQGTDSLRTATSKPVLILMTIVGVILLIACANIAGLLLARGTSRQREIATRLAVGAPRARLIYQLLTESLLLSAAGGVAGFTFAYLLNRFTPSLLSQLMPITNGTNRNVGAATSPDVHIVAFAVAVILATGIVFGLIPALRATRVDLLSMMKQTASNAAGKAPGFSSGKAMVALQASLSMLLLIGAGLFIRTVVNLRSATLGYQPDGLLYVRIEPRTGGIPNNQRADFFEQAVKHLGNTPGVTSSSAAVYPLLSGISGIGTGTDTGAACTTDFNPDNPLERTVGVNQITPHFFDTMKLSMLAGRDFDWTDRPKPGGLPVAIVNDAFARKYYSRGKNAVGEKLGFGNACPNNPAVITVIGVVADARSVPRNEAGPMIYLPFGNTPDPLTVILRTAGDPAKMSATIRRAMAEFDSNVPLFGEVTPLALREQQMKQERLLSTLLMFFGSFALLLCSLGIYGLLSYTVSRRTSEIGLHMALGAQKQDVIRMIVSESLVPVALGLVFGTVVAFALTRFVQSLLYGLSRPDPWIIAGAVVLFISIAAVAAALPAHRASLIDPLKALRYE